MEYVLIGALGLGILLFVIGWLVVVANGFQRHPVVGLLSLIPGVNLLVLPSLWYRVSGWVITGFVGVLLALGAWFSGADEHLYKQAQSLGMNVAPPAPEAESSEPAPQSVTHTIEIPAAARSKPATTEPAQAAVPAVATEALALPPADAKPVETSVPVQAAAPAEAAPPQAAPTPTTPAAPLAPDKDLPANALYHIVFKKIAVDKLADTQGQYVRVVQKDGTSREGKVHTSSGAEILLEERMDGGSVTHTIKLDSIREASIMTREKGGE